jgi:hypothetical protein
MADARQERLAENEAHFRLINEEIETRVHATLQPDGSGLPGYVCECGDVACAEIVRMSMQRYEQIRRDSRCFLVATGHENPEVEVVIDRGPGYVVVRKLEPVAEIVRESDPRQAPNPHDGDWLGEDPEAEAQSS